MAKRAGAEPLVPPQRDRKVLLAELGNATPAVAVKNREDADVVARERRVAARLAREARVCDERVLHACAPPLHRARAEAHPAIPAVDAHLRGHRVCEEALPPGRH